MAEEDKEKKRLREAKRKRATTEKNLRNVEQYILSQKRDFLIIELLGK